MSNTLTNLIPDIHDAIDIVSREQTGMIPSVAMSSKAQVAAKDETIYWPVTASSTTSAVTPSNTIPSLPDEVIGNESIVMDQYYKSGFHFTGEEQKGLGNASIYMSTFSELISQKMRALSNQIESDLLKLYYASSRAIGTAGTAPFASDLSDINAAKKILDDNGAPGEDRHIVINTTAGMGLRNLTQLTNVNQSGTDATLRRGALGDLSGFSIRESAQVQIHTKGTATGFDCTAIEPVGETTIACDGSDSGTVLVGDVVTRGVEGGSSADTNKYVISSGSTLTGNASGNFILNENGLRLATTVADEWTIGASYTANLAFSRNAFQLAIRIPKLPEGGDMATGVYTIADPVSGLIFLVCEYPAYKARYFEVSALWGVAAGKPEHSCIIMG